MMVGQHGANDKAEDTAGEHARKDDASDGHGAHWVSLMRPGRDSRRGGTAPAGASAMRQAEGAGSFKISGWRIAPTLPAGQTIAGPGHEPTRALSTQVSAV